MGSSNLAIQPSWAPSSFAVCCLWWDFHSQLHNQASKGLSVRCWVSFSQQLLGQLLSWLVELEVKPKLLDSVQPMSVPALDKVLHVSLEVHQVLAKDLHQALDKDLLQALDKDLLPFLEEVEVFLLDFLPLSSPLKLTSLQPSIAAAVAEALRGRTTSTSVSSTISAEEQERINALQSANAQYNFEYKVGDADKQTYISQTESRNGEAVQGAYSYVDPAGALITVNYEAGPMGYTESRDVQEGYVQIDPKNIPQPWTGPLAGMGSASAGASSGSVSSGRSQSDLIAQILRAIQPQITSAVQTAIGSRNRASSGSLNDVNFQSNARRGFNSEANLVSSVIGALQPQISGAVQSALSRTRTAAVSRPVARPVASSGVNDIFGGSGVKIQTPEFNIEY